MRVLELYLRSRRAGYAVLGLIGVAVLGGVGTRWFLQSPDSSSAELALIPAVLLTPLLSASVIGASLGSPIGELENAVSRSLPRLRAIHLLLLGLIASVSVMVATQGWDYPDSDTMVARNLAGFVGIALVSAWLIGGRLSWIPPLVYAILALVLGNPADEESLSWAWPVQAGNVDAAIYVVLGLFIVGVVLFVWKGPKFIAGD